MLNSKRSKKSSIVKERKIAGYRLRYRTPFEQEYAMCMQRDKSDVERLIDSDSDWCETIYYDSNGKLPTKVNGVRVDSLGDFQQFDSKINGKNIIEKISSFEQDDLVNGQFIPKLQEAINSVLKYEQTGQKIVDEHFKMLEEHVANMTVEYNILKFQATLDEHLQMLLNKKHPDARAMKMIADRPQQLMIEDRLREKPTFDYFRPTFTGYYKFHCDTGLPPITIPFRYR